VGVFRCIVADPPWKVKAGRQLGQYVVQDGRQLFAGPCPSARDLAYDTMSVDEIKALPVAAVAAVDAHLYLWTINRYVEQAYAVARAWGFEPSTLLTWAKNTMGGGLGGTFGLSTEFCLFCRRGRLKALSRVSGSWWNWKRPYDERGKPRHSAKPPAFHEMVELVSPGPRLELFARAGRDGWTSAGHGIDGVDIASSLRELSIEEERRIVTT
jgi:N6-adenosine-specific RNA methylase IME4